MAYSDYGAYVWKNGEDITKDCADKTFYFIDGKWIDFDLLPEDYSDEIVESMSGHAVLIFDNFAITFYKVYDPTIVIYGKTEKQIKFKESEYTNKKIDLKINKTYLNSSENIIKFEIKHKNDYYCVICGSAVGNGFDNKKVSKFIKKHIYFKLNKRYFKYHFKSKLIEDTSILEVFDKLERLDDIDFCRYTRWEYGIKLFLKNLIQFKWEKISFYWAVILETTNKIRVLK